MSVSMNIGTDINGSTTYNIPVSNFIYRTTLAANTSQNVTIPSNCTQAIFSFSNGTDVWVDYFNSSASLPTGGFLLATSELNPVGRLGLTAGNTLAFISPTTAYIQVAFYP